MEKVKVLYIAGWGRSGSTLLGNILGSIDGFTHLGEVRYIWDRGVIEDWECGCGKKFSVCPKWNSVLKIVPDNKKDFSKKMLELRERLHSRDLLFSGLNLFKQKIENMSVLIRFLEKLYCQLQQVFEADVIVDSSKFPSYAYLLDITPNIDLYIIHLIRNPYDVAYSWWQRRKLLNLHSNDQQVVMSRIHPFKSGLLWFEWNYLIYKIWGKSPKRYFLIRYEDFVLSPKYIIKSIIEKINGKVSELPFLDEKVCRIKTQHTISGNPVRFNTGVITVDNSPYLSKRLPFIYQLGIFLICWPLLKKFGYYI